MRKPDLEVVITVLPDGPWGGVVEYHSFRVRLHTRNTLRLESPAAKQPPRCRKAVVPVNNRMLRPKC